MREELVKCASQDRRACGEAKARQGSAESMEVDEALVGVDVHRLGNCLRQASLERRL